MHVGFAAAEEKCRELRISQTSADEGVRVEIDGSGRVLAVDIDSESYRSYDRDSLADAVSAAFNFAKKRLVLEQKKIFQNQFSADDRGD